MCCCQILQLALLMRMMVLAVFSSTTDQPQDSALKKQHRYTTNWWNNNCLEKYGMIDQCKIGLRCCYVIAYISILAWMEVYLLWVTPDLNIWIVQWLKSNYAFALLQVLSGQPLGAKLFGYSLAGNMDLDKNSYPDLAVGSLSDSVFVFKWVNWLFWSYVFCCVYWVSHSVIFS